MLAEVARLARLRLSTTSTAKPAFTTAAVLAQGDRPTAQQVRSSAAPPEAASARDDERRLRPVCSGLRARRVHGRCGRTAQWRAPVMG
jgi:hypothetical protein